MLKTDLSEREVATLAGIPVTIVKQNLKNKFLQVEIKGDEVNFTNEEVEFLNGGKTIGLKFVSPEKKLFEREKTQALHQQSKKQCEKNFNSPVQEFKQLVKNYIHDRAKFLEVDQKIFGGTPVLRGTRITVYAIRGRLRGGDTIDSILNDYPEISPEALKVAVLYAKSYPLRGRAKGLPR